MELYELRKTLVEQSGHYELVDEEWSDQGANFYINAGLRYLDRMADFFPMAKSRMVREVDPGQVIVQLTSCRYVENVQLITDDEKVDLERLEYDKIVQHYPVADLYNIDQDDPYHYATGSFRLEGKSLYIGSEIDYDSILILPPPAQTRNIIVHGAFHSPELTQDYHSNTWSVRNPDILIMAAMRSIEIFHRNMEGAKGWESAILREIHNIQMDQVSEEVSGVNQMEG